MTDNRWGNVVPDEIPEPMGTLLARPVYEQGRRVGYFWARDATPLTQVGIVPERGSTPNSLVQLMIEGLALADDGADAHEIHDEFAGGRWFEVGPVEPATMSQLRSAIMDA